MFIKLLKKKMTEKYTPEGKTVVAILFLNLIQIYLKFEIVLSAVIDNLIILFCNILNRTSDIANN